MSAEHSEQSQDSRIAVQTEMMLLSWAESSTRGRTVTFLLPEDSDEHPFKHFSRKQGRRAGQRFMAVFVQLDSDDSPVHQPCEQPSTGPKLSQIAAALCKDQMFWRFADERSFDTIDSEDAARNYMLSGAGITSRSQFDSNHAAADWLRRTIKQFHEYRDMVTGVL